MPRGFERKSPSLTSRGCVPAPLTPPLIRVVLLHTEAEGKDYCPVCVDTKLQISILIILGGIWQGFKDNHTFDSFGHLY